MCFESIASIFGLLLTSIGLFYTGNQIYRSRKVARAEFLLHLDEMLQEYNDVHINLRPGGEWQTKSTGPKNSNEWVPVERYMGLFERINILVNDKIVDIDTIDRLYGYRIINISNNKIINQEKLIQEGEEWNDFINLRDKIIKKREERSHQ
ncbi:MAG: hypothetical protein CVU43_10135 [Chloroflexi bacterium HGW-Chloroflexi-5]|nr:MAG: hypothetical protein CVU43_10135 [Chloroflexi bacterium HGW-Chloroflexi-5]